jgi:DNA repair exonuclease SbcCD ATPase subunit
MSDKERLEEIKNSYLEGIHRLFGTPWVSMPKENFDWLIQQAERAQKNAQDLEDMDRQLYSEQQQNKRYRKAINNIIEKVMLFGTNEEVYEAIQDAIKALEGDND